MILSRALSLVIVVLFAGQPCFAQSDSSSRKQYRVEVIAFHYQGPDTSAGEEVDRLMVENYLPGASFDMEKYNRVRQIASFTNMVRLGGALERLRSSPQYSVLAATSWVQPLLSRNEAVEVPLGDSAPATSASLEGAAGRATSPRVSGFVRIHGGHLLFADLNLRAMLPRRPGRDTSSNDSFGSSEDRGSGFGGTRLDDGYESFRISETRRIKLDEIHYFDHPYIGAVLSVTRHDG